MPRPKTDVKRKPNLEQKRIQSVGLVDLHFHGAYGIDLMVAEEPELDRLAHQLWKAGVGAFCPTTLTAPPTELLAAVGRLGRWTEKTRRNPAFKGALPLGLHLEGPFISTQACGAHPTSMIRALDFKELDTLWEESRHTLKILTIAPETLDETILKQLKPWAKKRGIVLSLGHSRATKEQASRAFDLGFSNVTHAWNAMGFQHRAPGVLGAAVGRKDVFLEMILDQVHVDPTVMRWTLELHGHDHTCFVSDCAPAAGLKDGQFCSFGSLSIHVDQGAARLANGGLVGGGSVITEMYEKWLKTEIKDGRIAEKLLRESLPSLTAAPLKSLGIPLNALKKRKVRWSVSSSGRLTFQLTQT